MKEIILASQSPRRKTLLEWAEIPFKVMVVPTEEHFSTSMNVLDIPIHIARQKVDAVKIKIANELPAALDKHILAADTIVVLGEEVINKPSDKHEAIEILKKLSGKEHRVITGVVLEEALTGQQHCFSETTYVQFHALTNDQIIHYVEAYKPYDKAGAYAIQEWIGVVGIAGIRGDFYNVMGLPVSRVVRLLNTINF